MMSVVVCGVVDMKMYIYKSDDIDDTRSSTTTTTTTAMRNVDIVVVVVQGKAFLYMALMGFSRVFCELCACVVF